MEHCVAALKSDEREGDMLFAFFQAVYAEMSRRVGQKSGAGFFPDLYIGIYQWRNRAPFVPGDFPCDMECLFLCR